jgi:membrane protein DedA with SNARE-associated domain/rhodanese-related sulfurtransferase
MAGLQELFERFGVVIVFFNALLHELAVPIPLTPTVLLAGAASSEVFAFVTLVLAVVVGSVIGNAIWFAAGRRFGPAVLGLLCRFSLSPDTCVARSADGFGRWGAAFFIIGRFIPGVSLVTPPVAGALGMRWSKFLALTALGATLWAVVVILLGAVLQEAIIAILKALAALPAGLWLGTALLIVGYVLWRLVVRRRAMKALGVPRLTVAALRSAMQSSEPPVLIDVRGNTMQQILAQRIPGAISLALAELETYPLEQLAGRAAVLYCTCPNEASAAAGVRILQSRGHADARALSGGLNAWIASGYEVEGFRTDVSVDTQPGASAIDASQRRSSLEV